MLNRKKTDILYSFTEYITTLKNSKFFKVFIWDILSKGAEFALLPIYLKILSKEEYGFYTYVIFIVTTVAGVINLGMDTAMSKMYYEEEKYNRGTLLFSTSTVWFSFFLIIMLFGTITGLDNQVLTGLLNIPIIDLLKIKVFIYLFIFFQLIRTTLNVFFVIDDNALVFQKYNLIRTALGNIIIITSLYFLASGNKAYARLYIEPAIYILFFLPLILLFFKKMKFKLDWKAIKHGFSIGLPMVGALAVGVVYNLSDKYYLQKNSGYESLAVYNLAIFLTLPISLVFSSFQTVWLPKFLKEKSQFERFSNTNSFLIKLVFMFAILLFLIVFVLYASFYFGILENEYKSIFVIYPLIFFAKAAEQLTQLYNNFVVVWGKTIFNLIMSMVFAAITFFFNSYFIPRSGIQAAIIILISIALIRFLSFFLFVKYNYSTVKLKNELIIKK